MARAGTLDPTFGAGLGYYEGTVTAGTPAGTFQSLEPTAVATQADGSLVVAFTDATTGGGQTFAVDHLTAAGTLDTSFGTAGKADVALPSGFSATLGPAALLTTPGGQIILVGQIANSSGLASLETLVARFNADGTADSTFGTDGVEFLDSSTLGVPDVNLLHAALQPDGSLVLAGSSKATASTFAPTVVRLTATGLPDATFGTGGVVTIFPPSGAGTLEGESADGVGIEPGGKIAVLASIPDAQGDGTSAYEAEGVAIDSSNRIILVGANPFTNTGGKVLPPTNYVVARLTATGPTSTTPGDFDGDGIADPAIYLPAYGSFAIQTSSGGTGEIIPFGSAGAGNSIPAPGDYDGTGQDDVAVYLPSLGLFAIQDPTGQTTGMTVPFGSAGAGNSIPVPGDYYGTGQTDIAVYLPAIGAFAVQDPTGKTSGEVVSFGTPGLGNSIPMPGDYDGSGKTEFAVYIPSLGDFIYRPANGGADVVIPFGTKGPGQTLPMQGDYTGIGHDELGVYLPASGVFAYQTPTGVGPIEQFGIAGAGQTIPVTTTVLSPFPGSGSGTGQGFAVRIASILGEPDSLDFVPDLVAKKSRS